MIPPEVTPCFSEDPEVRLELTALFEATDPVSHREAAAMCGECPFREQCGGIAAELSRSIVWAGAPEGTWGGRLYVAGRLVANGGRS